MNSILRKLLWLTQRRSRERELREELQFHLEEEAAERRQANGLPEKAALLDARRSLGNLTRVEEDTRAAWGWSALERLVQDLRFGLRVLGRQRAFTLTAVLTLGLSIGANFTIFSFVDTFFLRPIPAVEPETLAVVEATRNGRWAGEFSYPSYLSYRDQSKSFKALAAHYSTAPLTMTVEKATRMVNGAVVTANYFPMLGIRPQLGRFFLPDEDAVPDRDPVAVIGYRMWQDSFGGTPDVLGKQLRLNGIGIQIVGVAPPDFRGVLAGFPNDVWLPSMMLRLGYRSCDAIGDTSCRPLALLGRLAPGRTLAEAETELNLVAARLAAARAAGEQGRVFSLQPAIGVRFNERASFRYQMKLLMGGTGILLLIACANIATLLLVRGTARRKEIAIRLCVGAGRWRLIRTFLIENLLLAVGGGGLGLLVAVVGKRFLSDFYVSGNGVLNYDLSFSPRSLAYGLAVTFFTGLLFGLLPAIQASRHDLVGVTRDGSRGPRHHRLRSGLVIGQVALSLAMLVVAVLLVRSDSGIRRGANFEPEHVAILRLRPMLVNYRAPKAQAFVRESVARIEATPGVQSVSLYDLGLAWRGTGNVRVRLPEHPEQRADDQMRVEYQETGPRFCETMQIPLLEGREFNIRDGGEGTPRVAMINETLARRLWPRGSAVGGTLQLNDRPYSVVGVSQDAQPRNVVDGPSPQIYLPYWQQDFKQHMDARLLVRVAGDPGAMLPTLRRVIAAVDPNVPVEGDLLTRQLNFEFKSVALTSTVLTWAGALALFLSMIGLYAVLSYLVGERMREIGIRMAIGAERRDVLRLVFAKGLRLALSGVGVGLLAAFVSTRMVKSLLYGVSPTDGRIFAGVAALMVAVALLACWIPARRATKVDPLMALRSD